MKINNRFGLLSCLLLGGLSISAAFAQAPKYHEISRTIVGGEGGWDYLSVDARTHLLYLSHGNQVNVVNPMTKKVVATIADTPGVHGIALDQSLNKGFISCGRGNSVVVFDINTSKTLETITVPGQNPDCITLDPVTQRVFTFNGRSSDSTVIDAKTDKVLGSIPLSGKPEFFQPDGRGMLFGNIENKNEVVQIDAKSMRVVKSWSISPADGPSGFAVDLKNHLGISVTDGKMVISDLTAGKVAGTVDIGEGPDATSYDPKLHLAFSSNGQSATMSIVSIESKSKFTLVQTLKTEPGARTMILDPSTHIVYVVTAQFPAAAGGTTPRRPSAVPGSFMVIAYGP